jgi:NUBPL iron-transfer P-loop NTPase
MPSKAKHSVDQVSDKSRSRFIVVHGDKGGVGKSFTAQAVVNYLTSKGESVAVIDADTANPDVSRMFEGSLPTAQTNLRSENGWMDVVDFVVKYPGQTVVLNTPAGIGDYMKTDVESFSKFLADQDVPTEMELWWVMNVQHDSVNLLNKALKSYGQHFRRIRVVCNLHFANGDSSAQGPFFLWNESELRANIEKKNGMTLFLPGLHLRAVKKIYAPGICMPFTDAADVAAGEKVGLETSERWKLTQWLADVETLLAPAFGENARTPADAPA